MNGRWTPRYTLLQYARIKYRGGGDAHASIEECVSEWRQKGICKASVEYYDNASYIAINRLISDVRRRGR